MTLQRPTEKTTDQRSSYKRYEQDGDYPRPRQRMAGLPTATCSSPAPAARCTSGMRKNEWPRCAAGAGSQCV
jgi:hypothetical protein